MSLFDDASLIVTPNGVKEGKLYSIKPSDGSGDLSVTRATTATRVNSAGLVELVPYNLCTYSEELNIWTTSRASVTTNATTAPNGTTTADKVITDSTANTTHQIYIGPFPVPNLPLVISVYAKKSEYDYIHLGKDTATTKTWFDLTNGTVGTQGSDVLSASIESVGNGWYRCINVINNTSTSSYVELGPASQDGTRVISGTPSGGIFAWGAQLVEGSVAKDYLRTETRLNIPRLDYTNGSCPSILVEPQRTNLVLRSEEFNDASWVKTGSTIANNSIISPNGVQNADTFSSDGSTSFHILQQITAVNIGTTYSMSVFAKKSTNNFLQIFGGGLNFGVNIFANFDLNNGVIGTVGSSTTARIENYGNGWYKCTISGAALSTGTNLAMSLGIVTSATSARAEINSLSTSVYLWGAQMELGANATSYIPTTTASVTRNADVISKTGISSLIGQTEGTMFLDFVFKTPEVSTDGQIGITSNVSPFNRFLIWNNTTLNTLAVALQTNGSTIFNESLGSFVDGQRYKIAVAYKSGDSVFYVNGTQVTNSTATFAFTADLSVLTLASYETNTAGHQSINSSILFKTRLSNSELAQLTTI